MSDAERLAMARAAVAGDVGEAERLLASVRRGRVVSKEELALEWLLGPPPAPAEIPTYAVIRARGPRATVDRTEEQKVRASFPSFRDHELMCQVLRPTSPRSVAAGYQPQCTCGALTFNEGIGAALARALARLAPPPMTLEVGWQRDRAPVEAVLNHVLVHGEPTIGSEPPVYLRSDGQLSFYSEEFGGTRTLIGRAVRRLAGSRYDVATTTAFNRTGDTVSIDQPSADPICPRCHGRQGYPNSMTHHGAPPPCRCP